MIRKREGDMVSNQVLQSTIEGIKEISHLELGIMDADGREVAVTAPVFADVVSAIPDFAVSPADSQSAGPYQFFKVMDEQQLEYVIVVYGETDSSLLIGRMAAFQLKGLMSAFKERYDKDSFMKNLLLDNLLLVDIYIRAKKLHVENNVPRLVYLIESNNDSETNTNVMDVIRGIYPVKTKDFITAVDENNIILVKDVSEDTSRSGLEKIAGTIGSMLSSEAMGRVRIAMGSMVRDLKDISRSYKEAKMALEVGKIFYEDKYVINYNRLGIGRLIYQLPLSLCKMYIEEIFKDIRIEDFDEETLNTVSKFFENSLNISETSRQLYIHRNTLVYRLDKLQKNTGLDIRTFDDAITFKIALMVAKYMNYMELNGFK